MIVRLVLIVIMTQPIMLIVMTNAMAHIRANTIRIVMPTVMIAADNNYAMYDYKFV